MLKDSTVTATVAVKDKAEAKKFYSDVLGLRLLSEDPILCFKSGDNMLYVYDAPTGGTNQASSATWNVDDIETVVEDLKSRGVTFEHYDFGGGMNKSDVHVNGDSKAAWFKDPSGNTLAIVQM